MVGQVDGLLRIRFRAEALESDDILLLLNHTSRNAKLFTSKLRNWPVYFDSDDT